MLSSESLLKRIKIKGMKKRKRMRDLKSKTSKLVIINTLVIFASIYITNYKAGIKRKIQITVTVITVIQLFTTCPHSYTWHKRDLHEVRKMINLTNT